MNDFTKEELLEFQELIYWSIADYGSESPKSINFYKPLHSKIQTMIDNYCEHEFQKTLARSGMCFIAMCHKCNKQKLWGCDLERI